MWSGEYSILAPQELKGTVGNFAPQFNNLHQHDSQEFCSFLMDSIHEDLNRVKVCLVSQFESFCNSLGIVICHILYIYLLIHHSPIIDLGLFLGQNIRGRCRRLGDG